VRRVQFGKAELRGGANHALFCGSGGEGSDGLGWRGIVENTGQVWAQALLDLALEMKEVVTLYRQSDKPVFSPYYTRKFSTTYDRLVAGGNEVSEGLELNPLASRIQAHQRL
jgi:hypothetical protein